MYRFLCPLCAATVRCHGKHHRHTTLTAMVDDEEPLLWPLQQQASSAREQLRRFLTSKAGHYSVLALVSLDVSCIFAEFVVKIVSCDTGATASTSAR